MRIEEEINLITQTFFRLKRVPLKVEKMLI